MIHELDTVALTHDIPEHGLKAGDLGAVVHCHNPPLAYEVEFVTAEGGTIGVLTLSPGDIRRLGNRDILHVRELASA
jgi:hypothetical protein